MVTRVMSYRLPITPSTQTFLEGLNDSIVSILLGREAVYRSLSLHDTGVHQRLGENNFLMEKAREDLDRTVYLISKSFRRECVRSR
jgi:hypothetical protein